MTHDDVKRWLAAYIEAWRTYDPQAIGALFTGDAVYGYGPWQAPTRGRQAIVDSWLAHKDAPDSWQAEYWPLVVEGKVAVVRGRTRYFDDNRTQLRTEYDNVFEIHFDEQGRATEFREWFIEKPQPLGA
jgi:hypothetical protein